MRLLLGEKILGRGSRGREGLGIGPRAEAGGLREAKEMIISKRTVGPEQLSETRETLVSIELQGGGGPERGGTVNYRRQIRPSWISKIVLPSRRGAHFRK